MEIIVSIVLLLSVCLLLIMDTPNEHINRNAPDPRIIQQNTERNRKKARKDNYKKGIIIIMENDEIEFIKEYCGNKSIDQLDKEMKEALRQMKMHVPENPPISRDDEWRDEDCWDNDYVKAFRLKK